MEIIRKGKILFSTSISLQILEITAWGKMVPEQLFIGHSMELGFSENCGVIHIRADGNTILQLPSAQEIAKPICVCMSQNSTMNHTLDDMQ